MISSSGGANLQVSPGAPRRAHACCSVAEGGGLLALVSKEWAVASTCAWSRKTLYAWRRRDTRAGGGCFQKAPAPPSFGRKRRCAPTCGFASLSSRWSLLVLLRRAPGHSHFGSIAAGPRPAHPSAQVGQVGLRRGGRRLRGLARGGRGGRPAEEESRIELKRNLACGWSSAAESDSLAGPWPLRARTRRLWAMGCASRPLVELSRCPGHSRA